MTRMKMIKNSHRALPACAVALGLAAMSGCGGAGGIDYVAEDDAAAAADANLSQFADAEAWTERLVGADGTAINIDAEIAYPKAYESMGIVSVSAPRIDEDYKRSMIEAIFGDSVVYDGTNVPVSRSIEDAASVSYKLASGYDGTSYLGMINGREWAGTYYFLQIDADGGGWISLYPEDARYVAPNKVADADWLTYDEGTSANASENPCTLTEDEAVEIAQEFLEQAGFSNQALLASYPLSWNAGMGSYYDERLAYRIYYDGYVLYFMDDVTGAAYDALSTDVRKNGAAIWVNAEDEDLEDQKAHTVVYVGDDGVFAMDIRNRLEVTAVTENVGLLSLSDIEDVIRGELEENTAAYLAGKGGSYSYKTLRLSYMRIADGGSEGSYTYIPVWELYGATQDDDAAVYVNAVDGSVM